MSEQDAAQAEESTLDNELDQVQEGEEAEANPESATDDANTDKPAEDGFQKRINKVTADKYAEKRRADSLQQKLDDLAAKPAGTPSKAPALEDFDHDEEAFNAANIKHQVKEAVSEAKADLQTESSKKTAQDAQEAFNGRITAFAKEDFDTVSAAIPELPPGVADVLVNAELGPELIYHLGTHLDVADKLAGMTSQAAMMELGRISAGLNAKTEIKPSAAPDPIETLKSGGKLSNIERGPKGATFE